MLYVKFGKNQLHGFRGDVVWKCWWTTGGQMDGRQMPAYTISSRMSLRLKWAKNGLCAQQRQISLGICPVWPVFAVRMKKAWVLSYPLSAQQKLIRLDGCPGWSESLLGKQSFCWFCREVAQFCFKWIWTMNFFILSSQNSIPGHIVTSINDEKWKTWKLKRTNE